MIAYFYVLGCIAFTVYGQLILKWRLPHLGEVPVPAGAKLGFLLKSLLDPFIFSGYASAFIASFFWLLALSKLELSHAYPFMSGAFVLVFIFSVFLFNESVSLQKILGLSLIVIGIAVLGSAK